MSVSGRELEQRIGSLRDAKGALERPLADGRWPVPGVVELDGDRLVYRWESLERSVSSGPDLLDDFIRLPDAPDDAILRYAQDWGVLELCEHGLPHWHSRPALAPSVGHQVTWCDPLGYDPTRERQTHWEPLAAWRRFAKQARALLTLAAQLHEGSPTRPEDWHIAFGFVRDNRGHFPSAYPPDWTGSRSDIARKVNDWLAYGASRLIFDWRQNATPDVMLSGARLFGALAAQMMFAVARSDGLAVCSSCTFPYFPSRRPTPRNRRYCDDCRARKVPGRDAQRDSARRKAATT